MSEVSLIIMGAIIANILTPAVKHLWRSAARYGRRHYLWHDSTQRIIRSRRSWRKTSNSCRYTHRVISALASNLLDIDYIEWREAINKNNARLYRQSVRTSRWERFSRANIEDCIVDPSYDQFLQLMMDEDSARLLAENKPIGDALKKWAENDRREFDDYKSEFNKHIEIIDIEKQGRYESVLYWGFMSNLPPDIAAKIYEENTLSFPEDLHLDVEDRGSFSVGHIYRFIHKKFPARRW